MIQNYHHDVAQISVTQEGHGTVITREESEGKVRLYLSNQGLPVTGEDICVRFRNYKTVKKYNPALPTSFLSLDTTLKIFANLMSILLQPTHPYLAELT